MKAAINIAVAAVLVAVSAWLAHLHVVAQTYHPVVRLSSPDGLVFTAVQDATPERRTCGRANDLFIDPLMNVCKDCKVVIARCERHLEGFERAVHEGQQLKFPVVQGPGVRMAIEGPKAVPTCEEIATLMVRSGSRSAACVHPAAATPS